MREEMRDEVMADKSWRPHLQRRLQRLHSLMLGAELAMEQQAWERALGLNFRLLRFLECECETVADRLYVAPIRKKVLEMAESAKQELYSMIERNTFAQAGGLAEKTVFSDYGDFDIGTIKNSKYFECLRWDRDGVSRYTQSSPERKLCSGTLTSSKPKRQLAPPKMAATLAPKVDLQVKKFVQSTIQTCYENADATGENIFSHSVMSPLTVFSQEGEESEQLRFGIKRARDSKGPDLDGVKSTGFVTAKKKWALDSVGKAGPPASLHLASTGCTSTNKTLGVPRRGIRNCFVPPVRQNGGIGVGNTVASVARSMENDLEDSTRKCLELLSGPNGELPDKLRNLEPRLLEHISNEIMEKDSNVRWDDIGGLEHAKKSVTEMVIWPLLRPDIFQGCRAPGKGLLLFGPPGTGKTMIGKAIAGEANATFFSISASSLTSKWIGEGEKLVRALFGVATCRQPAVIFIDEIDSLLSQRKADGEHESSRRLKTQFLIEMEGIGSGNEQLLLIGATNRPQELDEAARRRFTKRLYIPLPSAEARAWIVRNLLLKDGLLSLSDADIASVCASTEGYSGSDVKNLVKEASLGPLREVILEGKDISKITASEMRPITIKDFCAALYQVRPSVSQDELGTYEEWNHQFGSLSL